MNEINKNTSAVKRATCALSTNTSAVTDSTQELYKNTDTVRDSSRRVEENTRAVERSRAAVVTNTAAVGKTDDALKSVNSALLRSSQELSENTTLLSGVDSSIGRLARIADIHAPSFARTTAQVATLVPEMQALLASLDGQELSNHLEGVAALAQALKDLKADVPVVAKDSGKAFLEGLDLPEEANEAAAAFVTGLNNGLVKSNDDCSSKDEPGGEDSAAPLADMVDVVRSIPQGGAATALLAALYFFHQWSWKLLSNDRLGGCERGPIFSLLCYLVGSVGVSLLGAVMFALNFEVATCIGWYCQLPVWFSVALVLLCFARSLAAFSHVIERSKDDVKPLLGGRSRAKWLSQGRVITLTLIAGLLLSTLIIWRALEGRSGEAFQLLMILLFTVFGSGTWAVVTRDDIPVLLGSTSGPDTET